MYQEYLLQQIKNNISNCSLIEAVATALDISYDAAHRRTSLKSKLSLKESILLARYYNISLDKLYSLGTEKHVTVQKTPSIENETSLEYYFNASYQSLQQLAKHEQAEIIYSAKDIPLFYTLNNELLNRFKIYAWLKILNPNFKNKPFNDFQLSLSLIEASKKLGSLYASITVSYTHLTLPTTPYV